VNSKVRVFSEVNPGFSSRVQLCGFLALFAMASHANAAASPAARDSKADAGPPKSIFTMPTGPQEGKDPFFPKSSRPYINATPVVPTITNSQPAPPMTFDLKLNGISGTTERPLAIINGKTFEKNEEGEVHMGPAKINIRVVEISSNTATVQVGGQQQILHMRGNF
jgi:hypothetical protein